MNLHLAAPRVRRAAFRNKFCRVGKPRLDTFLDEMIVNPLDRVFIHLQTQFSKVK
jgi:hypothetical protein